MKLVVSLFIVFSTFLSFGGASEELNSWLDSTIEANNLSWEKIELEFAAYTKQEYKSATNVSDFILQFDQENRFDGVDTFNLKNPENYPDLTKMGVLSQSNFLVLESKLFELIFSHALQDDLNAFTYLWIYVHHINSIPLNNNIPNNLSFQLNKLQNLMSNNLALFQKVGLYILARKIFTENTFIKTEILLAKQKTQSTQSKHELTFSKDEIIYDFVPDEAKFIGGVNNLTNHIMLNIIYPSEAKKLKQEGNVFVQFVIYKDGSIGNITIIKGNSEFLNQEAIRVVSNMPNWIPARLNKVPVNVNYIVPINFKLG